MAFRACSLCGWTWESRADFLADPDVVLVGYQVVFDRLETGFFLFNHTRARCGSTLSVQAGQFTDLYAGPVFVSRLQGSPECGGHCLHTSDLQPCPAKCECAFVRDVLQVIRSWPKQRLQG